MIVAGSRGRSGRNRKRIRKERLAVAVTGAVKVPILGPPLQFSFSTGLTNCYEPVERRLYRISSSFRGKRKLPS